MPGLPLPIPIPFPIPWPTPSPGTGIPIPQPTPSPGIGIPIPQPTPSPVAFPGGTIGDVFAAPFKMDLDWKLLLALAVILGSIEVVNNWYPDYVWTYVLVIIIGLITPKIGRFADFGPKLKALVGG